MGESHGTGVGTGAFAGAAGLAGPPAAGPPAAGPPEAGVAAAGAAGFGSPSGAGGAGDLISSGITANAQTSGFHGYEENVNFYQLDDTVSTSLAKRPCHPEQAFFAQRGIWASRAL